MLEAQRLGRLAKYGAQEGSSTGCWEMEFRECVLQEGKKLSIFALSNVKAISEYKVEEILEIGVDGFWIGYEDTHSKYALRRGRPVAEILTKFREHGRVCESRL
jgi:hypothetical protein